MGDHDTATGATGATGAQTPPDKPTQGATAQYELPLGAGVIATIEAPLASVAGLSIGQRAVAYDLFQRWNLTQPRKDRLTIHEAEVVRKILHHDSGGGCTFTIARLRRETWGGSNTTKDKARLSVIEKGFVLATARGRNRSGVLRAALPKAVVDDALVYFEGLYSPTPPAARTPDIDRTPIDVDTWMPRADITEGLDAAHVGAITANWRKWARGEDGGKGLQHRTENAARESWRRFIATTPRPRPRPATPEYEEVSRGEMGCNHVVKRTVEAGGAVLFECVHCGHAWRQLAAKQA